jgi:nicotinamide riboside kinase
MTKTTVINLFGAPGSGKSTLAADLFSELKKHGYQVEMVREWVKLWAWEGRKMNYADQMIVFGNQVREETSLYNKVDIIITDSPLILSGFYESVNYKSHHLVPAAKKVMELAQLNDVNYWNVLVKRDFPYEAQGRFQTEKEANKLERQMEQFLKGCKLPYDKVKTVEEILLEIII